MSQRFSADQMLVAGETVPPARQVATGAGLLGGGNLSADRTLTPDFGSASGKVCQGNDSRLSDARTPTAHASSHAGGSDPLTPQALEASWLPYADGSVPGGNTVANTVTETAFASTTTFAGNSLEAGQIIRVMLWGVYSQAVVPATLRGKIKLGSTVILDTGTLSGFATVTNAGWKVEAFLVVTAVGAGGAVEAQGYASFATAAAAALAVHVPNTAAVSVDFTASQALTVTVTWGTANASDSITLRIMSVELMG